MLALPGCKSKKNDNKKGDVINDLVLKANTKEDRKYIFSNFELKSRTLPVENIVSINDEEGNGFYKITDTEGKKHYYSVVKEEVIFVATDEVVSLQGSSVAGGFLQVTKGTKTTIYDALGNILVKDFESASVPSFAIKDYPNDQGVCAVSVTFNQRTQYFVYDNNGVATLTLTLVSGDSDYEQGSSMQGIVYDSLDDYGHQGYKKFKSSGRYVIFDNSNNEVASFTDPNGEAEFFVGDYLIYQNSIKLDDNNNNYDYINSAGERYSLETYRINYLTAKKETLDVKYVLGTAANDINPFFNDKGVYTYSYANLRTISDKKILSNTMETYIIDGKGVLHDNVTGIALGKFERFGNNYYNSESETIYDGNLNEISILNGLDPKHIHNAELIICKKDGNYGAINHEGRIAIPFEYDIIYTDYMTNQYMLAVKNGLLCKLTFNARQCIINQSKTFEGYDTVNYVNAEQPGLNEKNNGAAIYLVSGTATSGQTYGNYLSLLNDTPINIQVEPTSIMTTKISTAEALNKCMFAKIEQVGGNYYYYSSQIAISR